MTGPTYTISNRTLLRDGEPYFSVGFNYHPSATGCDYWREWDSKRLSDDLAKMAELGFNTARFFVFWADFEPAPGEYDRRMIDRLRTFVALATGHGMQCLPSLLTIWMNGQHFDLPWRRGRSQWLDTEMLQRQQSFVGRIAEALWDAGDVVAYDLGDELIHVDEASALLLSPAEVHHWYSRLADAIRKAHPGALVLQANEASAVTGKHNFRPEYAQPLDLVGLHGFPVWSPFHVESVGSPKASAFVPYLVRRGLVSTAVLVDELGSYGCGESQARQYLRAAAHSAFAAGACGVIVWCWQDFTAEGKPYALHPGERSVGLLRADGRPKPAMAEFQTFARRTAEELAGFRPLLAPVGIRLLDRHAEDNADCRSIARSKPSAAFYSHLLLQRAHIPNEFTDGSSTRNYRMLICPSVRNTTLAEQRELAEYVEDGGVLLYTSGDLLQGVDVERLFGVKVADYTLRTTDLAEFSWEDVTYRLCWKPEQLPILEPTTAEVLATFPNGSPALSLNRYGQGAAYYLNAPIEEQLNAPYRLEEAAWHYLYLSIAKAAGVAPLIAADVPDVEIAVLGRDDERCALVINHSSQRVSAKLHWTVGADVSDTLPESLELEPKAVRLVYWHEIS